MADISASLVKKLREKTGIGMMDCKKALIDANGDIALAIEELRKSSGIKAIKKAERSTADGVIAAFSDRSKACMVEINCETDFVIRNESFINFTKEVVTKLSSKENLNLKGLLEGDLEKKRKKLVQRTGENIVVRRIAKSNKDSDSVGLYVHSNKKVACITSLQGGNQNLAKDIAMQVVASDPIAVSPEDISKETLDKEREIYEAQSSKRGKSTEIVQKIIESKIKKFLSEVILTEQDFIKEPGRKISDLLNKNKAKIIGFKRFEVGEGIEKEDKNFANEVMLQIEKT